MFIKHIRSEKWDEPGEFVFEVRSYSIRSMGEDKLLVMAEDGQGTAFEVHKDGDELYIMNDNGRTIDSYVWPKPMPIVDQTGRAAQTKEWQIVEANRPD